MKNKSNAKLGGSVASQKIESSLTPFARRNLRLLAKDRGLSVLGAAIFVIDTGLDLVDFANERAIRSIGCNES